MERSSSSGVTGSDILSVFPSETKGELDTITLEKKQRFTEAYHALYNQKSKHHILLYSTSLLLSPIMRNLDLNTLHRDDKS